MAVYPLMVEAVVSVVSVVAVVVSCWPLIPSCGLAFVSVLAFSLVDMNSGEEALALLLILILLLVAVAVAVDDAVLVWAHDTLASVPTLELESMLRRCPCSK